MWFIQRSSTWWWTPSNVSPMRNVCTPFLWPTPCFDQLGCPYLQVDDLWVNGQVALFFVVESQSYGMRRIHYYDSEITATVNRNLTDARAHHIHDEWQNSHFLYSSMFSVLNIFYIFHHFTFNRNDSRSIFIVNFSMSNDTYDTYDRRNINTKS